MHDTTSTQQNWNVPRGSTLDTILKNPLSQNDHQDSLPELIEIALEDLGELDEEDELALPRQAPKGGSKNKVDYWEARSRNMQRASKRFVWTWRPRVFNKPKYFVDCNRKMWVAQFGRDFLKVNGALCRTVTSYPKNIMLK